MTALDRQLRLLGTFGVFTYPFACVPFLFFHFKEHGVGLEQYMWLIACYYWAMVLMEVPTGILADRYGRKSSMLAGSLMLAVGFFTIYGGDGLPVFCTGQVLIGLGHSLLSGATTAMVFDSLKRGGRQHEFLRVESRIHAMRLLGTGGSFLLGGVVALYTGIATTIAITACLCVIAAGIACLLREGPRPSRDQGVASPLLRVAIRDLRSGPLVWILVYYVLLFGLLRFAFHTYQPYFEETVFDHRHPESNWLRLGLLFAALNFFAAPCSRLVPTLTRRFGYRTIFAWLPALLCVAFLAMAAMPNWLGVALFFVHQIPFGLHWALIQEYVNQRITATARATALSILSFTGRISFALWIPLAGRFETGHGTPATYLLVGVIGLALTAVWCTPMLGARLLGAGGRRSRRE